MLICDTHADTLYAMPYKKQLDVTKKRLLLPGHTRVQALALFVGGQGLTGDEADLIHRELAAFRQLLDEGWRQIRTLDDALPDEANALLTIEGGEAFGSDLSSVAAFAEMGVRIAAPVWNNENLLAHPAVRTSTEGLKPLGREMAAEMQKHKIALDISHLNERGAEELMDSPVPPMASHSCARALCDHPRNLTDAQLKRLILLRSFVGVNFYPVFLHPSGKADIDTVIDHICHICYLGGEGIVGLGSDFDGIEHYPKGLRHAGRIPALFERMEQRGFSAALIQAVAGENFARYMRLIDDTDC